MTKMGLF